jgi:hypothetical protein
MAATVLDFPRSTCKRKSQIGVLAGLAARADPQPGEPPRKFNSNK